MSVFDRLKGLFSASSQAVDPTDIPLATAVVLLELSMTDEGLDPVEMKTIVELLSGKFGCSLAEAHLLIQQAEERLDGRDHFYKFIKVLKDNLDERGREGVMEMLWQLVCVNNRIDDHESAVMRKIAGLLYVSDKRSAEIRQKVQAMNALENPLGNPLGNPL
jgi:uncharacterized tellurite resistance protein B-like protein